jgi:hypothetical protein
MSHGSPADNRDIQARQPRRSRSASPLSRPPLLERSIHRDPIRHSSSTPASLTRASLERNPLLGSNHIRQASTPEPAHVPRPTLDIPHSRNPVVGLSQPSTLRRRREFQRRITELLRELSELERTQQQLQRRRRQLEQEQRVSLESHVHVGSAAADRGIPRPLQDQNNRWTAIFPRAIRAPILFSDHSTSQPFHRQDAQIDLARRGLQIARINDDARGSALTQTVSNTSSASSTS